ncbi:hypothetical protein [Gimesia chilikensis]|uniref:hypothetical protein n=1 Tax=Gimesia chilikensis TaxID=2605989 RepID=UPI0011882F33|nr:hypothetical protein [Gimesia chilikensis]QDT84499.1 hypothetical protein MalM14_21590 [Gimesia chilikensis]
MDGDLLILKEPVTAKYALSVFREQHRLYFLLDYDMLPREELTSESTVEEWREQMDLLDWRPLGQAENELWEINLPDEEWKQVLEPEDEKTLGGVCELIARHASAPVIREETFFGKPCRPASAFLTIQALLQEAGADVSEISPSTDLSAYSYQYGRTFLYKIANLSPGTLPRPEILNGDSYRGADLSLLWMTGTLPFALMFSLGMRSPWFLLIPGMFFLMYLLFRWELQRLGGKQLKFGELKTFRDLAELMAAEAPVVVSI